MLGMHSRGAGRRDANQEVSAGRLAMAQSREREILNTIQLVEKNTRINSRNIPREERHRLLYQQSLGAADRATWATGSNPLLSPHKLDQVSL